MKLEQLPQKILARLLRHDAETGKLYWLARDAEFFSDGANGGSEGAAARWNTHYAGKEAFTSMTKRGYFKGSIFDQCYRAHRVIWALVTGDWPPATIDHINGNTSDNRLGNLRLATHAENSKNRGCSPGKTSEYLGVTKEKGNRKWRAALRHGDTYLHLGMFDCEKSAARAYDVAAMKFHGDFARINLMEGK